MAPQLRSMLDEHLSAMDSVLSQEAQIQATIDRMQHTFESGNTVFVCGNGGSASDSQHFAAELTGRFERHRRAYPAVALTTDTSALTAIANDYGFDQIFSRQLEALGRPGDMLFVISTSGNSSNLTETVRQAKTRDIFTVGLLGRDGGQLASQVDIPIIVRAQRTSRIQEAHIFVLHHLCDAFEPK